MCLNVGSFACVDSYSTVLLDEVKTCQHTNTVKNGCIYAGLSKTLDAISPRCRKNI